MESQNASLRLVDEVVIERLFMALHGYFGNPFLDKFKLGEQQDGKDKGIENAKRIWLTELRTFTALEVFGALRKIRDSAATFPPSLPEFVAACKASRRPIAYSDAKALPAPRPGLTRERLIEQRNKLAMRPAGGLATLFAVTAQAVSSAGADDEASVLLRLEREICARKP